jgi:hypothetical protein
MSYGVQTYDAGGVTLLDASSKAARVVDTQTVTVPLVGITNTYSIPADCSSSNSAVLLDSRTWAFVSAAGVASVVGSQSNGTTTMRVYRYA